VSPAAVSCATIRDALGHSGIDGWGSPISINRPTAFNCWRAAPIDRHPVATSGTVVVGGEEFTVVVYEDPSNTRVTLGFVFGAGVTTAIGKGWQLRAEVRDNLVQIATVAGPTAPGVDDPEIVNEWKNLWSFVIGADIVLEKKRGRRY